jgi:mediator of RNA polymerase II transcription subunit 16
LATTSRQLRLFKIDLQWLMPTKGGHPQNARFGLSLSEKHQATTSWLDQTPEQLSTPEVSHLHVVPSMLDNTGTKNLHPLVISVRSRSPSHASFPMAQSVVERWEAVEEKHGLQPALEQLANRRNSISSELPTIVQMVPLEPTVIDKCVVGVQTSHFGKIIILTFADGSVQHRDRDTFAELYHTRDTQSVSHLKQLGWIFPEDSQCMCFNRIARAEN